MNLTKRILLTILALLGFITTIKLAMIYWDVNTNKYALSSFCAVNEYIDCDGVAKTIHSQFFGIPLAWWGLFLYFVFLFFTFVDKFKNIRFLKFLEVFERPESYICALGMISFLISMILAGISIFEIHKVCVLCFFTYFLNLLIAIIAKPAGENFLSVIKISFQDFIKALKKPAYAVAFGILTMIALCFLTYAEVSNQWTPQVKKYKEIKQYEKTKSDTYNVKGNIVGDPNATLVVNQYTDYQCPFCFVLNTMLYRAVSELDNVQIIHHNLPYDTECNKYIPGNMHPGSCMMAKYSIAAQEQGKFWEMNTMLFDKTYKKEDDLLRAAKRLGFDTEKLKEDAHSQKTADKLQEELKLAKDIGIEGTPAIQIGMEIKIGIEPYEKLKERLIKAGAKEKK